MYSVHTPSNTRIKTITYSLHIECLQRTVLWRIMPTLYSQTIFYPWITYYWVKSPLKSHLHSYIKYLVVIFKLFNTAYIIFFFLLLVHASGLIPVSNLYLQLFMKFVRLTMDLWWQNLELISHLVVYFFTNEPPNGTNGIIWY